MIFAQTPNYGVGTTVVKGPGLTTLDWSTLFGGTWSGNYDVRYRVNGGAGIALLTNTALTSTTVDFSGLSDGNLIEWQVKDVDGTPNWAANTFSFYLGPPVPTPGNNATGVLQTLSTISWTAFDEGGFGAGNYDFKFDNDANPNNGQLEDFT